MKHPNGRFFPKACRCCGETFQPEAPSCLYCSPECKRRGLDNAYFMREYGIPLSHYEALFEKQGGKCAICGEAGFAMKAGKHTRPDHRTICLDHDHVTGQVRGLLCHNCNRALGLLQDSEHLLQESINYLRMHREGATTIPQGSTPEAIAGGKARLSGDRDEEIVWTRRQRRAA